MSPKTLGVLSDLPLPPHDMYPPLHLEFKTLPSVIRMPVLPTSSLAENNNNNNNNNNSNNNNATANSNSNFKSTFNNSHNNQTQHTRPSDAALSQTQRISTMQRTKTVPTPITRSTLINGGGGGAGAGAGAGASKSSLLSTMSDPRLWPRFADTQPFASYKNLVGHLNWMCY